jgi:hypothetical protein
MKTLLSTLLILALGLSAQADEKQQSEEKKDAYPLETCVISGEKLGDHGKPYVFEHEGQEVRLCCKACLKDFNKDPDKHLKTIEDAKDPEKQKKD